jgi:hypothetical protein
MGVLREAMQREMALSGFAARTQKTSLAWMRRLIRHVGVAPGEISESQVREYLASLAQRGLSPSSINQALPPRFVRVRHYGLQANGCRTRLLDKARAFLCTPTPPTPESTGRIPWKDLYVQITGRDPDVCRSCGRGVLRVIAVLAPTLLVPYARAP